MKKYSIKMNRILPIVCLLATALQSHANGLSVITVDQTGKPVGGLNNKGYSLSQNGRYVAFSSGVSLTSGDTNSSPDAFVRDIVANKTLLVSVDFKGKPAGKVDGSYSPIITPDGRYVIFKSTANGLVEKDSNNGSDIFVRDLKTNITKLVTVNKAGEASSGKEKDYKISADGRFVIFESNANDLVAYDTNNKWDVFVRDLKNNTTKLISINSAANDSGNGESEIESMADNGVFIKFISHADNLVANDNNGKSDCFMRNIQTNKTILLETCDSLTSVNHRYVTFTTDKRLVISDTNNKNDVYRRDLQTQKIQLVSVNSNGKASLNSQATAITMSADGRYIMFDSNATDLVKKYIKNSQYVSNNVYLRDMLTNTTKLISVNAANKAIGGHGYLLSDNGQTVLFSSDIDKIPYQVSSGKWALFSHNLTTNKTALFSLSLTKEPILGKYKDSLFGSYNFPTLSADGELMVFSSSRWDLVAHDNNNTADVFAKYIKTGQTNLVSMNITGSNSGSRISGDPVLSADGKVLVFKSNAHDLVKNDNGFGNNFFAKRVR